MKYFSLTLCSLMVMSAYGQDSIQSDVLANIRSDHFAAGIPDGFDTSMGSIPEGFEQFFAPTKGAVTVTLYSHRISLMGEHNLHKIKILPESIDKLKEFLKSSGVDSLESEKIVYNLSEGVLSSPECKGLISECTLYPETVGYVYDDAKKQLKLFVNEKYLKFAKDKIFFEPNNVISFINNSGLYGYVSRDGGASVDLRNTNILSLPQGYLKTDTSVEWNDDSGTDFETYSAVYSLDMRGFSLEAGYTEFLDYGNSAFALLNAQYSQGYHATLFSNDRMSKRNNSKFGHMSLFVPETTEVEIYRGDRLMYRSMLAQGIHDISYSPFDEGIYNVQVVYKVGGQIIREETRQISNTPIFDMEMGDTEWYVKGGRYAFEYDTFEEMGYFKSGMNWRPTERSIVGGGVEVVGEDFFFGGRHDFIIAQNVTSGLLANVGLEGSSFVSAQFQFEGLGLYAEHLSAESNAAMSTYNSPGYTQFTAAYSISMWMGVYTFNYFYYNSTENDELKLSGFESSSISMNTSYSIGSATLSGTLQYDFEMGDNADNLYVGINLNIPFDDWSLYSGITSSSSGGALVTNTARYRNQINDRNNMFLEASLLSHESQDTYASGLVGMTHSNDYLGASGTVYGTSQGDLNASFNARSTQVITSDDFKVTSREAESYLLVENVVNSGFDSDASVGSVEISNESEGGILISSLKGSSQLIPVKEYSKYNIGVSTGNSSFVQMEDVYETTFSKPGTVKKVVNRLAKVEKYLVSFVGEDGESVSLLNCSGEGCNSIEEIVDDVYQVSIFDGYDFVLHSGNDICLLPNTADSGKVSNVGSSVCVTETTLAQMIKDMPEDTRLYYLGATKTLEEQNTSKVNHIKAGNIYGKFILSERISIENNGATLAPREIKFPIIRNDSTVSSQDSVSKEF